jgi:hypothetical protein
MKAIEGLVLKWNVLFCRDATSISVTSATHAHLISRIPERLRLGLRFGRNTDRNTLKVLYDTVMHSKNPRLKHPRFLKSTVKSLDH